MGLLSLLVQVDLRSSKGLDTTHSSPSLSGQRRPVRVAQLVSDDKGVSRPHVQEEARPYLPSSLILKGPQKLRSTLRLPALLCGFLDVHLFLHPSQSWTPTNAAGDLKASTNNFT